MGVKIKNRSYLNRHHAEPVDFMLANAGDWQRLTFDTFYAVEYVFSSRKIGYIEGDDIVLSDGTYWVDYGFKSGDTANLKYRLRIYDTNGNVISDTNIDVSYVIGDINGDRIELVSSNLGDSDNSTIPYNTDRLKISEVSLYSDVRPESSTVNYSHIKNSEASSGVLKSVVDGTETIFNATGMDSSGVGVSNTVEPVGYQSGMSVKNVFYKYLEKVGTHTYKFQFGLDFCISAIFENQQNYEENTPPDWFVDSEALTDIIKIVGYPEQNNPNRKVSSDVNSARQFGNCGWHGENYNGLDTDIKLKDVEYFDPLTLLPIDSLSYSAEVRVKATIEGVSNLTTGQTKCVFGFTHVPNDTDLYHQKKTIQVDNLMMNTGGDYNESIYLVSGSVDATLKQGFSVDGVTRMDVKDVKFSVLGSDLVFEGTFVPTAEFSSYMESLSEQERKYVIWVSTSDYLKDTNSSDLTNILVDYNQLIEIVEPAGEWDGLTINYFAHPFDGSDDAKASDINHFVEDDILVKSYFNVDITDVIPTGIRFAIEAEKTDGEIFELQSYSVDLTTFSNDANGIPQYDIDQIRGFKLGEGNNKNWVKVQRYSANDIAPSYGYVSYYGFKIRWEDWIARANVPADFFDGSELNNGFNNDWFHYFNTANWSINFVIYTEAIEDGQAVEYKNKKQINFTDYESNANVDTVFTYKRASDLQVLDGSIMGDERTKVEVLHSLNSGTWGDIANAYGTICIGVKDGAGQFSFRQLSTIWESENDNPLLSLLNNKLCKITLLNPTDILLECLIEPSLLEESAEYKITSRIGNVEEDECNNNVLSQASENVLSQAGECIIYT